MREQNHLLTRPIPHAADPIGRPGSPFPRAASVGSVPEPGVRAGCQRKSRENNTTCWMESCHAMTAALRPVGEVAGRRFVQFEPSQIHVSQRCGRARTPVRRTAPPDDARDRRSSSRDRAPADRRLLPESIRAVPVQVSAVSPTPVMPPNRIRRLPSCHVRAGRGSAVNRMLLRQVAAVPSHTQVSP